MGEFTLKLSFRALAIAAALFSSAAARADEYNLPGLINPPPGTPAEWIVDVSAMAGVAPNFPGANTTSFFGLPGVAIRRNGEPERFSSPDDSVSLAIIKNDLFAIGPSGNWVSSRNVKNNWRLFGLDDVNASVEIGGFAEWTPLSFLRVRAELRKAVSGYDGWAGLIGADVWHKWGRWTLSAGPRLNFNNDQYADAFFSVQPWQAALNQMVGGPLTPYKATGGLTSAGVTVAARYELSETWRVSVYGNYSALTGSVSDSPVATRAGSTNQYAAGVELRYSFLTKDLYWIPKF